ncbi:MAG: RluA family pseudouridine synthase [Simkania sp.]|nr:RluA family pseudouridine synthase [Simkania sp.]
MLEIDSLHVTLEEAGERLDKWLKQRYPLYSRTYFQYLIDEGAVLVNGSIVKKRTPLCSADEVEVCFLVTPEITLIQEPIPLSILFEDEHLIVINKPINMVVHPGPGHPNGTLVNALLYHCNLSVAPGDLRPGIVHRLDKDTTGVLIAAKHPIAHRKLVELFHSRSIKKTYIAICIGNPGNRTIEAPIGRHPEKRQEMSVNHDHGKPAITICTPLSPCIDGLTLVKLELITGRTHQLRVHMQHQKTPILGDPVYGLPSMNQKWNAHTQLLHAAKLEFIHPLSGELLVLEAPLPPTMQAFCHRFPTEETQVD